MVVRAPRYDQLAPPFFVESRRRCFEVCDRDRRPANETRPVFVAHLDLGESVYLVRKYNRSKNRADKLKTLVQGHESGWRCVMVTGGQQMKADKHLWLVWT